MTIQNLVDCDDLVYSGKNPDSVITAVYTNTGEALKSREKDSLFICIRGTNYDTHNDIEKLTEAGIVNIVAEHDAVLPEDGEKLNIIYSRNTRKTLAIASRLFFGMPDRNLSIIGITGTKGKTTTSYLIEAGLRKRGINCGIIGTNGIIYNGNTFPLENSTPGSYDYYRYLKDMADNGVTHVVAEITSQSLKQYRTYGTCFDIGVFTNLYPDHIGKSEHTDFDDYRKCKSLLFEFSRKAIINTDDENARFMAEVCSRNGIPTVYYSTHNRCADYVCKKAVTKDCMSSFKFKRKKIRLPIPGEFNIHNAMCAIAVLCEYGVDIREISEAFSAAKIPGRCERVKNKAGVNIIIDYAHSKESLENILCALRKNKKGKLYCVFGAGGNRSSLRRSGMGMAAAMYADFSVITSDNPRCENPEAIISDIISGIPEGYANYTVIPDRKEAIYHILSKAKKGDTVLLAGKGTQNYQEINGVKYPFDERETVSHYYND